VRTRAFPAKGEISQGLAIRSALFGKGAGYLVRAAMLAEGEGGARQKRERRHADHPEQIAHEARLRR
jgi:hypothetical protein